jgi:FKBP-type peptidyl-prolyl cis-trans isomerase FkpA
MKKINAIIVGVITSVGVAKAQADKDFRTLPNGLKFKAIEATKGTPAAEGDQMKLKFAYFLVSKGKADSLIFSSARNGNNVPVGVGCAKPTFKGDLMEGLALMAKGDSAHFMMRADSFLLKSAGMRSLPETIGKDDQILFCARMVDLIPKAEFEEMRRKESEKQAAEMSAKSAAEKVNRDEYLKKNNITQSPTASGLIVVMSQEGSGAKPANGQKVTVHYTGYLTDGTKFDSSVDRGEPFSFSLGMGQVIKGWDEGIAMLSPGAKAKLIIPSSIGYGGRNMGTIPPFSTLIFDVELIKFE